MKVIMKAPRWPNYHGFLCHIRDMVLGEGGDGWAWIVTEDPDKMADDLVKILGFQPTCVRKIFNGPFIGSTMVEHDQESWVFSTTEPQSNYDYDFLFIIED